VVGLGDKARLIGSLADGVVDARTPVAGSGFAGGIGCTAAVVAVRRTGSAGADMDCDHRDAASPGRIEVVLHTVVAGDSSTMGAGDPTGHRNAVAGGRRIAAVRRSRGLAESRSNLSST
jgi:hypothetical protein